MIDEVLMFRRQMRPVLAAAMVALALVAPAAQQKAPLLSDQEFWALSSRLSEASGVFHSDNVVSNEARYQSVIPDLGSRVKPGGVYLGVGPEQNFTYIAALRPRLAIILDLRRGNLHEHLLYKALFEMSATRAEFVARLFSRQPSPMPAASASVESIFAAVDAAAPSPALYDQNLASVLEWLKTKRHLPLTTEDRDGIAYVYRALRDGGPQIGYMLTTGRGVGSPGYGALMALTDDAGVQRSYLSSEERFQFVKALETSNAIVPVVGNFAGPKALRGIGEYLRSQKATVSAFYLSNVEQYLRQDGIWDDFCRNVATLPLTPESTFIRSMRGGFARGSAPARGTAVAGGFVSSLGTIAEDIRGCR